jgi:hypothetical protein
VLLLFKKESSRVIQSPHDWDGEITRRIRNLCCRIAHWESWPEKRGVAVEEKRPGNWEAGPFTFEIPTGI